MEKELIIFKSNINFVAQDSKKFSTEIVFVFGNLWYITTRSQVLNSFFDREKNPEQRQWL